MKNIAKRAGFDVQAPVDVSFADAQIRIERARDESPPISKSKVNGGSGGGTCDGPGRLVPDGDGDRPVPNNPAEEASCQAARHRMWRGPRAG